MKKVFKKFKRFIVKHWIGVTAGATSLVIASVAVILVIIIVTQSVVSVDNTKVVFFGGDEIIKEEIYTEIDSEYHISGDYGEAANLTVDEAHGLSSKEVAVGIDVSVWQGKIDWAKVAANGVDFAIIRCGYRSYDPGDGKIYVDPTFEYNISNAIKNGIKVGVYFYSTAINKDEAEEEARWVVSQISKYKISYPVAYDYEEFYNRDTTRASGLSRLQLSQNTRAFLDYVEQAGYKPVLYASASAVNSHWVYSEIEKYDFWLAHYTLKTNYPRDYTMWQCTSSGTVDGIRGRVDINLSFKNY